MWSYILSITAKGKGKGKEIKECNLNPRQNSISTRLGASSILDRYTVGTFKGRTSCATFGSQSAKHMGFGF
jgi:hypothetical protein